jgi:hypothetical protein
MREEERLNPLQLAITLHWDRADAAAARFPEAKRLLDHWLGQLEHFDPIFAPEYLEAPALFGELVVEEPSHADRLARVAEDERFHHWGLCQHLLAESQRAVPSSAVLSRELTELAVAVAMHLDPGHYHRSWTADLRAKSWCLHADACRRLGHTGGAEAAMAEAVRHAKVGTGSAELAARIEKTEASLSWKTRDNGWRIDAAELLATPPSRAQFDDPSSHSQIA